MKRRRILLGVAAMGYAKLVVAVIQLVMVPALAHAWGLALYGQWLMLSAIPVFLGASDFGFGTAAGNRLIGEVARGEFDEARRTLQSAQAVIVGCSVTMLALALALCWGLPDGALAARGGLDAAQARVVLAVLCLYALVSLQQSLFQGCLQASGRYALSTTVDSTGQLVEGLAVIVVAWCGGEPLQAAIAYVSVRAVSVVLLAMLALHHAGWAQLGLGEVRRERMNSLFRPALAAMMLPLAQAGYIQGTSLAVGAAAGPATLPVYASLRTLSRVAIQVLYMVNLPILPDFTAAFARGQSAWASRMVGGVATFCLIVGVVSALVLAVLGQPLLLLWTHGAIHAPQAMIVVTALALAAGALWNPLSNLLLAVNRHESFSYVYMGCALTSVALTYGLVRRFGVTGAALANLVLDVAMLARVLATLRRVFGPFPVGPRLLWAAMPEGFRRRLAR